MSSEECIECGDKLHANGDLGGALAKYKEASALTPDDVESWTSLGNVQTELRRWAQAADSYRHALDIEPADGDLQSFHARAVARSIAYAAAAAREGVSTRAGACGAPPPSAVALAATVGPSLRDAFYAVVDGFCTDTGEVRAWLHGLREDGAMLRGEVAWSAQGAARNDLVAAVFSEPEGALTLLQPWHPPQPHPVSSQP
jgi:tetratricopeptide (TPR) repeat protein